MRKVLYIAIAIFVCISAYFGVKMLIEYFEGSALIIENSQDEDATLGVVGFKKTPENFELINSYLLVNNLFIDELSKDNIVNEKNIKNIYDLQNFFPSQKMYYSARLKLEKAVYEGIPYLIDEAINLSNTELKNFYNNNFTYLNKTLGVESFSELENIVLNLSYLSNKKIAYSEIINNSISYNPYGKCVLFRIKLSSEMDSLDFVSLSVNAYVGYNTDNQQAPVIIFSALGGMS